MAEDIRVYDFEFNLLLVIGKYKSIHWEIYYNKIGTVELHLGLESPIIPILMSNPYLVIKQGVKKTAVITGKIVDTEVTVFGRTCNWLLSRRTTPDFDQLTGTVENLTRGFVETAFSDVNNFVPGELVGLTKTINFWRNTRNPTSDVVRECLENNGAGHEVVFDTKNKQWIYQVLMGKALPLILSEANKNAYDTQITGDCLDYYSCGWYEKQLEIDEETEEPQTEWVYLEGDTDKTGIDQPWIDQTGIYRWEAVLSGGNQSEAKSSLTTKKKNHELSLKSRNIQWGTDYNIGDIVRVQITKGSYRATEKRRIAGVSVWREKGVDGNGMDYGEMPILEELEVSNGD